MRARVLVVTSTGHATATLEAVVRGTTVDVISNPSCSEGSLSLLSGDSLVWRWTTNGTKRTNAVLVVDFDEVISP